MADTLVLGLGNASRGDDAVGLRAADALRAALPEGHRAEIRSGRYDAMDLVQAWRGAGTVHVIDALRDADPAGTIRCIPVAAGTGLGALPPAASTHALGLREAIKLAAALDGLPVSLTVWGVCGERFAVDDALSPAVAGAIPELVRRLVEALEGEDHA